MKYAELDVTTNFSFLRGASHPDELISRAAALGHAALGITDLNSLAGMVRAHQAAKEAGIKLCVGARLRFTDAPDVLVWVEDRGGYAKLCRLLTLGKRRAEKGSCVLRLDDLLSSSAGLQAALVSQSIDPQTDDPVLPQVEAATGLLKDAFGERLSLAASRLFGPADQCILRRIASVSHRYDVPMLATNHVHYHDQRRRMLQDILACIRHGCAIQQAGFRLFSNAERSIKSPSEMQKLFSEFPHAVHRTNEVAERCAFSLDELRYEYPDEIVPDGKTPTAYLSELAWHGATERYPQGIPEKVRRQIQHELTLIEQLKIVAYFLTVSDLVKFARSRGILCQGRGSAANSAVCYCIGVTSVDPARIDVLFERFISTARGEPPDIDIDFEHERREEVIQYVYEKYGRDRAGMTAEVITYRGRSAVRDVGKAMGLGSETVDQVAKRLEGWHSGAPSDAQVREAGLDPKDRTVRLVLTLTNELLGFPRHLSQHVGGMVMTRGPLCELVPIENASMRDRTVIEWDKDDIDALGILKVDVLALGMLTALAKALKLVNQTQFHDPPLELYSIPAEDSGVYAMISDADTIGVFQIESRAQMSMLPRLRPNKFYDLVIEVAIVRPGPIQGDMVHPYLRRRDGIEQVSFPKAELEAVLGKTLGVPLFQEQAMKVVMVAAGFSADEADQLRRAMAAWRYTGHIERFHQKIVDGMLANGYTHEFAERCFNQIRGFGEYGFPESHAASFALLVYASAWIKRYHPAAFCCALLNSQPMGFYAPAQIVRDAREHGVDVRAIDVNHSEWECTLEETAASSAPSDAGPDKQNWGRAGPAVRLGLRLVKGLSAAPADRIAECRRESGPFRSIDHFQEVTQLSVRVIAKLSEADAFASLPKTRRHALWETLALPEERPPLPMALREETIPMLPTQTYGQEIQADYSTCGLSLKGHPVEIVRKELAQLQVVPAAKVWQRPHRSWVSVAGIVLIRQRPGTAKGIVFETLEDETGIVNLIVRPDVYEQYRSVARHASLLQADGYVERYGQVQHVLAIRLYDLSDVLTGYLLRSRDFH
jgi:error-prone DNA polymerase